MNALINPYEHVNWRTVQQIVSISHAHSRVKRTDGQRGEVFQRYLDNAVADGARHVPFSNYYPSEPFYPLSDFFETVPDGVIASPNAEHHNFSGWGALHMNGMGCYASTGSPGGSAPVGAQMTAEGAIKYILNTLQYPDAGGITINHPGWSVMQNEQNGFPRWTRENSKDAVLFLLDVDDRVIGMEIRNSSASPYASGIEDTEINENVNSVDLWDEILITGKRCWGFCVPDHETEYGAKWTGRNVLLLDTFSEYSCLKAYRDGNFYSKIFNSELAFDNISYANDIFSVSAPMAESIQIIVDGERTTHAGTTASVSIPATATYVRAEAWMPYEWIDRNGRPHDVTEKIYSNPIMFKEYKKTKSMCNLYNKILAVD